jgi:stearoyl-CoA desaturase (delta-9 desaturase)
VHTFSCFFKKMEHFAAVQSNPPGSIHWSNSAFLIGTFLTSLIGVPLYIYYFGLSWFLVGLFLFFFIATGMSITLGYHRLFSHKSFEASPLVRAATLLFGAAAFENSAMVWCADHRRHHKHTDHDEDPYDITKGFFHAHIGWILFRRGPDTPLTWVRDLQKDRLVVLQHKYYVPLALLVGFLLPTVIGWLVGGWVTALGAFLLAGVMRVVFVHHMTFCINSLCHWIGSRPYSTRCSARDSALMAFFTFGEGYHNYHHEFQHDYRNGVKPHQFDPTKWTIWLLSRIGLVKRLRTVPEEKIIRAEIEEQRRQIRAKLLAGRAGAGEGLALARTKDSATQNVEALLAAWQRSCEHYLAAAAGQMQICQKNLAAMRRQFLENSERLREALTVPVALGPQFAALLGEDSMSEADPV